MDTKVLEGYVGNLMNKYGGCNRCKFSPDLIFDTIMSALLSWGFTEEDFIKDEHKETAYRILRHPNYSHEVRVGYWTDIDKGKMSLFKIVHESEPREPKFYDEWI